VRLDDLRTFSRLFLSRTYRTHNEAQLQLELDAILRESGLDYTREHTFPGRVGRVDFLVRLPAGHVALEVKVQGSFGAVVRQLIRYADCAEVQGVLLVTTLARLTAIQDILCDKPSYAVRLPGGCF
jgi:hypothetical protein